MNRSREEHSQEGWLAYERASDPGSNLTDQLARVSVGEGGFLSSAITFTIPQDSLILSEIP